MTPAGLRVRASLLAIALTSTARAGDRASLAGAWLLAGGYLGYGRAGDGGAFSYGGELSAVAWTRDDPVAGGWLQVGRVSAPRSYTRVALGAEWMPTAWSGVELGAARLWLDDGRHGHMLAVAPFVSAGLASLSLRLGVPLDAPARDLGLEASLVLTLKFLPFPLGDPGPDIRAPHGRPFASGPAPLAPRSDWG